MHCCTNKNWMFCRLGYIKYKLAIRAASLSPDRNAPCVVEKYVSCVASPANSKQGSYDEKKSNVCII